jgi:tripartite-type tricarboxylate transporter receptor subunit TctC
VIESGLPGPKKPVRQSSRFATGTAGDVMSRLCGLLLKAACIVLVLTASAVALDYPTKPVRIVVPFPPGGFNDIVARILATELTQRLGKQVIVDNKAGAGGTIAGELVTKAPKDGYTLQIISIAIAINPWMRKLPYDALKDYAPIAILAKAPIVVVVNPTLPVKSLKDFIALAKKQPGELKYASSGVGAFLHLGGELFKLEAGVDLLHIPFRGAGPAMVDVMGNHTQAVFASVPSIVGHVHSGKLRALAVGDVKRSAVLPDVPTSAEAGLPAYHAGNWIGLVAPVGTPEPIVARLHKEISEIQETSEFQSRFKSNGTDVVRMSVAEFGALMVSETARWGKVIRDAKIKAE